eukprot:Seg1.5 transcript_id=Seg1.5/GoldUCD/mRNA.D3Y31 product="Proteinase-activated receptor 4" protein_id=Seg1.5/GoldUCD/D3Y31
MASTVSTIFYCITFVIVAAALVLNILGIYLLAKLRASVSNQNVILINISLIKVIVAVTETILCALEIQGKGEGDRTYQVFDIINASLYGVNDLTVVVLTLDRLLATISPLQYNVRMTRRKLVWAILVSWIIGSAGIIPFFFFNYDLLYTIYYKIVFLTMDGAVLLIALATYGSILRMFLRRANTFNKGITSRNSTNNQRFGRFFYVSSLIIVSFILFVAIPDAVYVTLVIIQQNEDPMIERAVGLVWSIYLVSDPLIYIFLQKQIRMRLRRMFSRAKVSAMTQTSRYHAEDRVTTRDI